MKLLNRNQGPIIRAILAALSYVTVLLITQRHALAADMWACIWVRNDLKLAARRGAWYFRLSWIKLDASKDDFFDPTEGMDDHHLTALEQFVISRQAHIAPVNLAAEHAFIAARRLNNNTHPNQLTQNLALFKKACDALLMRKDDVLAATLAPVKERQGDFPITDAQKALADLLVLFPLDDMPWFLVSGTFLGLIRENGFLAHDYDIDIGVFETDIDIAQAKAMIFASDQFVLKKYDYHQSSLFTPTTTSTNPDVPYILKIIHTTGIHIDLFIHYRDTSKTPPVDWHGSSLHRWENSAFELVPYTFYGHRVLGPADADTYLTENYGDWRTPVTEFNCSTDTPNLALVPHPIAIVLFLKRYVFANTFDPDGAKQLEAELRVNGLLVDGPDGAPVFSGDLFRD